MMQLKHLALEFSSFPKNYSVFDAIPHAVSLETLMIDCPAVLSPSPGPDLELHNLQSLQRLALKRITPANLQVRETCSVFIDCARVSKMSDNIWDRVAGNISHMRCEDTSSVLFGVPASFVGFINLQDVYLSVKELGQNGANVSLENGLANVRRLCITGEKDLFITVPASVMWEEVWFGTDDALSITFVDVNAFVASCNDFATFYKSVTGTWMPVLCKALGAQGVNFEVADKGNGCSVLNLGMVDFTMCLCGACVKCLAPSQKAVRTWAI